MIHMPHKPRDTHPCVLTLLCAEDTVEPGEPWKCRSQSGWANSSLVAGSLNQAMNSNLLYEVCV